MAIVPVPLSGEIRYGIRVATIEDVGGVLACYAPYVALPVGYETRVPTLAEFEDRFHACKLANGVWLVAVCEDTGEIVGWAKGGRYRGPTPWTTFGASLRA
jgi:L-amino acid N-acyltransferase YncA